MFNCVCVDLDQSEIQSSQMRTARKAHKCGECRATIKPGDRYEYASGRFHGYWWQAKTCEICVRIRTELLPCGFYYGEVWETIHEANCDYEGDFCMCP
jgi:hypothetical protein